MTKKKRPRSAASSNLFDPASTSLSPTPPPINADIFNNDKSTWSKSKKKRMRLKRKNEEERQRNKITVQSNYTENGNNSGTSVAQDDETTTKKKNKRQRTNSLDFSSKVRRTSQAYTVSYEGKKALSDIGGGQGDPLTDPAISPCIDKKKSKKKRNKSVSVQSNNQNISQTTSTVAPDAKPGNRKNKNKTSKKNSDDEVPKMPNLPGKKQPKEQSTLLTTPAKLQVTPPKMMSTLQKSFLERLTSSRFRELNEELYTHSSQHSFKHFTDNPELFEQYHIGFRKQVKEWPVNPVDVIYKKILNWWRRQQNQDDKEAKKNGKRGMKNKNKLVVADFGCGDAKLAERLLSVQITNGNDKDSIGELSSKNNKNSGKATSFWCPFEVHSFDLVSGGNKLVTPADMCNVPLPNESVDVGVYSLALMGTNVADFVREGWRVLKFGGCLRVAEVRSRFEASANEDEEEREGGGKRGKMNNGMKLKRNAAAQFGNKKSNNGMDSAQPLMLIDEFLSLMERCGFQCTNFDRNNKMFLFMDFIKVDGSKGLSKNEEFSAKPCIYKRR